MRLNDVGGIVRVKNVRNLVTNELGDLLIGAYQYTKEAWRQRWEDDSDYETSNKGIVIHFKVGDKIHYIKSIVITEKEYQLIKEGRQSIVKDIGYILSVTNNSLSIYDLGSHSTSGNERYKDEQYSICKVGQYQFCLDDDLHPMTVWDHRTDNFLIRTWKENDRVTGLHYAVKLACIQINSKDTIVPHDLPVAYVDHVLNYTK